MDYCAIKLIWFFLWVAGVNDSIEHAVELAELLHAWGRGNHVNLIPFNPIDGSEYRRPYKKQVRLFSFNIVDSI